VQVVVSLVLVVAIFYEAVLITTHSAAGGDRDQVTAAVLVCRRALAGRQPACASAIP
jgi:hypothetical protein